MGEARLHLSVGLYRSTLTINARNVALKLKGNSSLSISRGFSIGH